MELVNKLFALLSPLIQDEPDQPAFADIYADEVRGPRSTAWGALWSMSGNRAAEGRFPSRSGRGLGVPHLQQGRQKTQVAFCVFSRF